MQLDLGAQGISPPGYVPMGHDHGTEIYPLAIDDESADVIRASHVLEHFPFDEVPKVIKHWASKLKPGGALKIAVPDFGYIAQAYLDGKQLPIEGYTMGGQTDSDDFHKALFDAETLKDLFRDAGLTDIRTWESDCEDCSRLPVSLNLRATKPVPIEPGSFKVVAVMSLPRTHWTANFRCVEALTSLGIPLQAFEGVYWAQCLERGFDRLIADGVDAILTIDYDTIYRAQDVQTLMRLMLTHPEADAICPLQTARGWDSVLATMEVDGKVASRVPREMLDEDIVKLRTGHFGLTLIRTSSLKSVPKPWFLGVPAKDGSWGDGHVDEDIYFWKQWAETGKTLYAATRVAVGHIEPMIKWPDKNLGVVHQRVARYWDEGVPKEVWK